MCHVWGCSWPPSLRSCVIAGLGCPGHCDMLVETACSPGPQQGAVLGSFHCFLHLSPGGSSLVLAQAWLRGW